MSTAQSLCILQPTFNFILLTSYFLLNMTTTTEISAEYYPRKSIRGRISIVRNGNRQTSITDKLTNPYAMGIYTGAAATGMITGMAMMVRRRSFDRAVNAAKAAKFNGEEDLAQFKFDKNSIWQQDGESSQDFVVRRRKMEIAKGNDDPNKGKKDAVVAGALSLGVAERSIRSGLPRLLGVRLESHSTSNKAADEILNKSDGMLDPKRAGTGSSQALDLLNNGKVPPQGQKVYITGIHKDAKLVRESLGRMRDPKSLDGFEKAAIRQQQRVAYRAQGNLDWDAIYNYKKPKAKLYADVIKESIAQNFNPARGRSLYIGGSDKFFNKNFKTNPLDGWTMESETPVKVYGNRFAASKAAIGREGLLNLMKANKGRVAAGAAILGLGGATSALLAKSAIESIRSDGMVKGFKRKSKTGKISMVQGFQRRLPSG